MKKVSIFISIIILFWFSGKAAATSPQPEEVKPGPATTVCTTHIVYTADIEKGMSQHEASATHSFDEGIAKKDVMEKMAMYINNKFKEWNVSEFKLDCKFQKLKSKEQ
ncbi:MAG: hypothetical protein HZA11_03640 [Nitrospirae bacterium]|nr:hypothetical protein [Nitrospirota bacterium]